MSQSSRAIEPSRDASTRRRGGFSWRHFPTGWAARRSKPRRPLAAFRSSADLLPTLRTETSRASSAAAPFGGRRRRRRRGTDHRRRRRRWGWRLLAERVRQAPPDQSSGYRTTPTRGRNDPIPLVVVRTLLRRDRAASRSADGSARGGEDGDAERTVLSQRATPGQHRNHHSCSKQPDFSQVRALHSSTGCRLSTIASQGTASAACPYHLRNLRWLESQSPFNGFRVVGPPRCATPPVTVGTFAFEDHSSRRVSPHSTASRSCIRARPELTAVPASYRFTVRSTSGPPVPEPSQQPRPMARR
jgi:hypothetical protein